MIEFVLATPANANAVHICPPCNQNTPYTNQTIAFKDIHAFLPPACVFGNGKDKHLVITCQHFDELSDAINYAQSIASNESVSVAIKTITEQF
ncbi:MULTISPECIES: hypothetical protein [unclassified Moraxella]|uniref:hypothetical protein n=1 Tax=unclassified Moraxella TaxID=2685852 RepID=UPI00359D71D8